MTAVTAGPTLGALAGAIRGRLTGGRPDQPFHGASLDTRRLPRGAVFFALPGARTDGHRYVREAGRRGAAAAVVARRPAGARLPLLRVASVVRALHDGAAWNRGRFFVPVVAVTGSNGKTTVKDLTAFLLSRAVDGEVTATRGNLNNHLGVPLTLFELSSRTGTAVIELAMNRPGEIKRLAGMTKPLIGVMLNAGAAHLQRFSGVAAVAAAKGELLEVLPGGGWAVLNADDPHVWRQRRRSRARVLGFGSRHGDVRAERITLDRFGRARFVLRTPSGDARVRLRLPGRHAALNAAAAAAVGFAFGLSPSRIAARLFEFTMRAPLRLERRRLRSGASAILDCYNANPDSCRAAFAYARDLRPRRLLLVLGEMRELGRHAVRAHRAVGRLAAASRAAWIIGVGRRTRPLVLAARRAGAGRVAHAPDLDRAEKLLAAELTPGSTVLFKGSRKAGLERLAARLGRKPRAL